MSEFVRWEGEESWVRRFRLRVVRGRVVAVGRVGEVEIERARRGMDWGSDRDSFNVTNDMFARVWDGGVRAKGLETSNFGS